MLKKITDFFDVVSDVSLDASSFAIHVLWNNFQCAWKTQSPLDEKEAFQGTRLQLSKDLCLMLKSCFQNPGILLRSKLVFGRVLLVMYLLFKCLLKLPSSLFGNGGEQGKAEPAKRHWIPSSGSGRAPQNLAQGLAEHPGGTAERRKSGYTDTWANTGMRSWIPKSIFRWIFEVCWTKEVFLPKFVTEFQAIERRMQLSEGCWL